MSNLYILTEERPKKEVIKEILNIYADEFDSNLELNDSITIEPLTDDENKFSFEFLVEGAKLEDVEEILIKIASGNSSFVDFLVFKQDHAPVEKEVNNENDGNNLLLMIEETKTSDKESRNTGVYQRLSKFVYADYFYPNVTKYMLYNLDQQDDVKKPSSTSIFGTNMLLTQNVKVVGKSLHFFNKYNNIDELIDTKNSMRRPPKGNVPILIKYEDENSISISGRLEKPKGKGNIGHDPNVGAITAIAKTLRVLGWEGRIVITHHSVSQKYLDNVSSRNRANKFLSIASIVDIELDGVSFDVDKFIPTQYWHYESSSEKMGTILLQLEAMHYNPNVQSIYENHAGCERGYFYTSDGEAIALPKKDKNNVNLYLPDLILKNKKTNMILLIEGKKSETLDRGLEEIKHFDSIENEFIYKYHDTCSIERFVVTFGDDIYKDDNEDEVDMPLKVLYHLNKDGSIYFQDNYLIFLKEQEKD